ncbi:MAG: hypothetical protein RLY21_349 [Planctomycetota bacterium]
MRAEWRPSRSDRAIPSTQTIRPLDQLLAGRRAVVARVPPPPVRVTRPSAAIFWRALILLVLVVIGVGGSVLIANASGRWWIGVIIFAIFAWIGLFLAFGLVGAAKVAREDRARRYERALEDPIGRLLPSRGSARGAVLDPASYRELLALPGRPVLVVDAELFDQKSPGAIGPLAPAGRMPEPETLDISRFPAGTWIFGLVLVIQSNGLWRGLLASLHSGAPVVWWNWLGVVPVVVGIYLIARDPWVRRKLGISGFFGRDAVIGAGWIVDERGRTWTVDDTVVLVTNQGSGVEVRLLHAERVHAFFLPILVTNGAHGAGLKPGRGTAWVRVGRKALAGAKAVGIDPLTEPGAEMPGPGEPLRLLLSSWSYPEPRPDLAMRE